MLSLNVNCSVRKLRQRKCVKHAFVQSMYKSVLRFYETSINQTLGPWSSLNGYFWKHFLAFSHVVNNHIQLLQLLFQNEFHLGNIYLCVQVSSNHLLLLLQRGSPPPFFENRKKSALTLQKSVLIFQKFALSVCIYGLKFSFKMQF